MTVGQPPRRRLRRRRGGANVEALREQALIEEARRRARQRRLGNLAVLALGLAVLAQAGFVPGGRGRGGADGTRPAVLAAQAGGNGKLAIVDSSTGSLVVVNPDGSGRQTLSRCTNRVLLPTCLASEPAWSPDGMRLAFMRGQIPTRPRSAVAFYVTDPDATSPRLLAHCGTCGSDWAYGGGISWSPDGTQIVYSATGKGPFVLSLFTVDSRGGAPRRLTDCDRSSCADVEPDWSPDGRLIVFSRLVPPLATASLYTVRPDGSGLTELPSEPVATDPRWSPDGRLIAYDSRTQHNIYVVAADGATPSRLLASDGLYADPIVPSWSPDGSRIVFLTPPVPGVFGPAVWTVTVDGKLRQRLARLDCPPAPRRDRLQHPCLGNPAPPVWSPDSRQIAFSSGFPTPNGGTFVVNADGSGRKRITRTAALALSWQRVH